jgi:tetratricopeptide (TPR) repeat protein
MDKNIIVKINKIKDLYENQSYKEALNIANIYSLKYNDLNQIPFFINLIGLLHLALKDWDKSIEFFKKSIAIDSNFYHAYFNLGITYFDLGLLNKSHQKFLEVLKIDNQNIRAKEAIIEILTFDCEIEHNIDIYAKLNKQLIELNKNIDLSKKISDQYIINLYEKGKNLTTRVLNNLDYRRDQIFRRNQIDLNCDRHMKIFNTFNTIPEFCFRCLKIVIYMQNILDLIKLSIIFDSYNFLANYERKCRIYYEDNTLRGYIYCSTISECNELSAIIDKAIKKNITDNFRIEKKRGCTEFSKSYPKYSIIKKEFSEMMQYPREWKNKEKIIDQQIYKDNEVITKKKINSIKGFTLSDFLIINKWLSYTKNH